MRKFIMFGIILFSVNLNPPLANAQVDIGVSLSAIMASVSAFNENSKAALSADSMSAYNQIFSRNRDILNSLGKEVISYQRDLAIVYSRLPTSDNANYPSRVSLKQYGDTMQRFVVLHKAHQKIAEKCMKRGIYASVAKCLSINWPQRLLEEAAVAAAVAVPGNRIWNWLKIYRS